MILQALHAYYTRMAEAHPGELAEFGFERKAIPVVIELTNKGELHQIHIDKDPASTAQYVLPKSVKRANNIVANLFWDNSEYTLGLVRPHGKKDRVREQHSAFVNSIEFLNIDDDSLGESDKIALKALRVFLAEKDIEEIKLRNDFDEEFFRANPNVSFKLIGDTCLICERSAVRDMLKRISVATDNESICLITGKSAPISRLHPSIKGVWGAQIGGANIISFNLQSFTSFNKKQGDNAPVSETAAFKYTEALNYLLRKDSPQRVQIGGTSTVFWTEQGNKRIESAFRNVFAKPEALAKKDDPNKNVARVKSALKAFYKGSRIATEENQRFYILGLAPNSSRIAVRFWKVTTIKELSINMIRHYDDIRICHGPNDTPEIPLFKLLSNICLEYKVSNLPPNLEGEVVRSILDNSLYPYTLLTAAVWRNKAEQRISFPRAAIIKACLNRQIRHSQLNLQEFRMALDIENTDIPYLLGRWFATLEKIQQDAHPAINATIKDRYYGAISSNPVSVFSVLDRLKNHHLAKLENRGLRVYREKLLDEIVGRLPANLPNHFSLQEQGCFAIGYHHQKQFFFKPKQKSSEQFSQSSNSESEEST